MHIENYFVSQADRRYSLRDRGLLSAEYIVLHNTAGGSVKSSVDYLKSRGYGYHFIIDRDGAIYQTVPMNQKVFHAGSSNWRGRDSLNGFSIGVCFANRGWSATEESNYQWRQVGHHGGNTYHDKHYWEEYSDAQIQAGISLCSAIVSHYPIRDIVRHDDIAIGRKVDTGPALDISPFEALIPDRSRELIYEHIVDVRDGDVLNIRRWPGETVVGTLSPQEVVYVRSFTYKYVFSSHRQRKVPVKDEWCSIAKDGFTHLGYVHSGYLDELDSDDSNPVA